MNDEQPKRYFVLFNVGVECASKEEAIAKANKILDEYKKYPDIASVSVCSEELVVTRPEMPRKGVA